MFTVRRLGLRCAISARFREGMFTVIDSEAIGENKTKVAAALKKQWGWPDTLVITGAEEDANFKRAASHAQVEANFKRAAANIHSFDILPAPEANVEMILKRKKLVQTHQDGANVEMILKRKKLVVTKEAVELLHKHLLRHYTPETIVDLVRPRVKRKRLVVTNEAVELLHTHLLRHYTPELLHKHLLRHYTTEESNTRLVFAALSAKKAHALSAKKAHGLQ
ncbi:hypothetical protein T484DRAFT_1851009 [Baffinella frigidus]|nr:hypothetical protein T484DRAFT_1851009 [Cryptophyta sp. CCMP2293]